MPLIRPPWYMAAAVVCGLLAVPGCRAPGGNADAGAGIGAAMDAQVRAWNNGDIGGFMEAYADSACFITAKERTCGRALVTARYEKAYPDRAAMGRLEFTRLEVVPAGAGHAWCTGSWRLVRQGDTLSGGFSLLWRRMPEGWRILRDHTY